MLWLTEDFLRSLKEAKKNKKGPEGFPFGYFYA